jgi:hypothetical protein
VIANVTGDIVNGVAATWVIYGNATVLYIRVVTQRVLHLESTTGAINVAVGTTPGTYSSSFMNCVINSKTCATVTPMK